MMIDVIGIDAPCMDELISIARMPSRNDSMQFSQISWQGGGKASTALIALARQGVNCGMIANVGDDLYGNIVKWDFERHGIDVSHVCQIKKAHTSLSVILSDKETMGRSVLWQGGGAPLVSELDEVYLKQAKYLLVPGASSIFVKAMKIVRNAGGKVIIDADRYSDEIMHHLSQIDVFIGSEFFFNGIKDYREKERCCRWIQEQGPSIVVFTFGEEGCYGLDGHGHYFHVPAFQVPVLDTTGAGDVFHGAFIYGLLQGWSAERCALWARATSAIKVTRLGGRAGIPDREMVENFIAFNRIDQDKLDERVNWYANALQNTIRERGIN